MKSSWLFMICIISLVHGTNYTQTNERAVPGFRSGVSTLSQPKNGRARVRDRRCRFLQDGDMFYVRTNGCASSGQLKMDADLRIVT